MKILFCILLCFMLNNAGRIDSNVNLELNKDWEDYKTIFNKKYSDETDLIRRKIWEENMKFIKQHNLQFDLGMKKFTVGINEFSDMSQIEFQSNILSVNQINNKNNNNNNKNDDLPENNFITTPNNIKIPNSWDWRDKGAVSPVGNQLNCNCGYAFAAAGALEGQNYNITKTLEILSKQQIIDCSTSYGNLGCSGGNLSKTYAYLADYGSELEEDYPFVAFINKCRYDKSLATVKPVGFKYVSRGKETDLLNAVYNIGPISAAINASPNSFKQYKNGIYDDTSCSSNNVNHAVLVIGYGEESGESFWIIKNSWGSKWGMKGYMKLSRDTNNLCGIASMASVPLIRKQ
uniref:Cathepsin L1 n=1 Tax=Dugesia japonica TaxID=6161 RepID=A0A2U8U452_DUGJA|nr:cathepsin L1 [Dugesia japonica]